MNQNNNDEERRARLLQIRKERMQQMQQKDNQDRNFARRNEQNAEKKQKYIKERLKKVREDRERTKNMTPEERKAESDKQKSRLEVTVRRGEMVRSQRLLSQDITTKATQHVIGIPVNKTRYNGFDGRQLTEGELRRVQTDPEAV